MVSRVTLSLVALAVGMSATSCSAQPRKSAPVAPAAAPVKAPAVVQDAESPFPRSGKPDPVTLVLDLRRQPRDWQMLAASLQGLVNRRGPKVYCLNNERDMLWLTHTRDRGWIREWRDISGTEELLERYRSLVRGVVVTDPELPATVNIAGMLAGVDDALIASPRLADELKLPVLHDLRGRWKTSAEAYEWAFDTLWPRLSHRVISFSHPNHTMPRDYLVQHKVFAFWISGPVDGREPYASEAVETRLMERLLARMPVNIPVLGYPYAGEGIGIQENPGVSLLSRYGKYLVPTDFNSNLSFHSGIRTGTLKPPSAPAPKLDAGKVYLSFIISDGDNLQVYTTDSFPNLWKDPRRGRFPIGWSISQAAWSLVPNVVDWFYRNATKNDAFVAAVSGIGYAYPDEYALALPESTRSKALDGYLAQTDAGMRAMGLRTNWVMRATRPDVLNRYARVVKTTTALFPDYGRQVTGYSDATFPAAGALPVFRAVTNWVGDNPEQRAREAAAQVRAMTPASGPAFMHVFVLNWNADLGAMESMLEQLGPRYVAVRPDHLASLYKEYLRTKRVDLRIPPHVSAMEGQSVNIPVTLMNTTGAPLTANLSVEGTGDRLSLPGSVRLAPGEPVTVTATGKPSPGRLTIVAREPKAAHRAEMRVTVVPTAEIIGSRPPASAVYVRQYEAEHMSHAYGTPLPDPAASGGVAWSSEGSRAGSRGSHIVFGPYETLTPGRYAAIFRLKRTGAGSGTAVRLDVAVSGGRQPLVARELSVEDMPRDSYRSVVLPFTYADGGLETRVEHAGDSALAVDAITLFRLP